MNQEEGLSGWSEDAVLLLRLSHVETPPVASRTRKYASPQRSAHAVSVVPTRPTLPKTQKDASPVRIAHIVSPSLQVPTANHAVQPGSARNYSSIGRKTRNIPPGQEIGQKLAATTSSKIEKSKQSAEFAARTGLQPIPSYVFDVDGRHRSSFENLEDPYEDDFARAESSEIAMILSAISDYKTEGLTFTRGASMLADKLRTGHTPRARSNVHGSDPSLPLDLLLGDAHILKSSQKNSESPTSSARSQQETPLASSLQRPGPIQVRPATAVKHSPLSIEHSPRRPVTAGTGASKPTPLRIPIASAVPYEPISPRPLLLLPTTPRSGQASHLRAFLPFRKPRSTPGEEALADFEALLFGADGAASPRATIEDNRDGHPVLLDVPSALQGSRVTPRDRYEAGAPMSARSLRQRRKKAEEDAMKGVEGSQVVKAMPGEEGPKKRSYFPKTKAMEAGTATSQVHFEVHFEEDSLRKSTKEEDVHRESPTSEPKAIQHLQVHVRSSTDRSTHAQHEQTDTQPPTQAGAMSVAGSRVASRTASPRLGSATSRRASLAQGGAEQSERASSPQMTIDSAHGSPLPGQRTPFKPVMTLPQQVATLGLENGGGMMVSPMLPATVHYESSEPKHAIVYKKNAAFSRELLKVGGRPPPSMKEGGLYSGRPVNIHISSPKSHARVAGWTYGRGITAGRAVLGAFRKHERERQKSPGRIAQSTGATSSSADMDGVMPTGRGAPTSARGEGSVRMWGPLALKHEERDLPKGVRGEAWQALGSPG